MKKLILILFSMVMGFGIESLAGTLSIPSRFVLQRPLNPALITEVQSTGIAVSTIIDAFHALAENSNCDFEILQQCDETGFGLLGYTNQGGYHLQLEILNQTSLEEGEIKSTTIEKQRDQQYYSALVATVWKNLSIGASLNYNQLKFRNQQSFQTSTIESGGDDLELSLNLGATINVGNMIYLSIYQENVLYREIQDISERKVEKELFRELYGYGLGGQLDFSKNWQFSGELYQLLQDNDSTQHKLHGGQFDIAWNHLMVYSTFVIDINDNYFERSGEGRDTARYGAGVAWYGEQFQFQLGRDPRFFDGLDGGIKLTIGFQFN